jgi:phenylpropionate dioxygenase-like ring-hydroxylating dioxygenase large terminal subunit
MPHYFDRHLVLWRDESGGFHLQDAFCPHLVRASATVAW